MGAVEIPTTPERRVVPAGRGAFALQSLFDEDQLLMMRRPLPPARCEVAVGESAQLAGTDGDACALLAGGGDGRADDCRVSRRRAQRS